MLRLESLTNGFDLLCETVETSYLLYSWTLAVKGLILSSYKMNFLTWSKMQYPVFHRKQFICIACSIVY
jgi:hypothetical protein